MLTSTLIASATVAASIVTSPVTNVRPIVTNQVIQVPKTNCVNVPVYHSGNNNGSIVGGIIGGVVGSNLGRDSRNRDVLTGVGVLVGSEMGRVNNTPPSYGMTQQCGTYYDNQVVQTVSGYEVTYRLNNMSYTTTMGYHPGSYVTIEHSHSVR